MRLNWLLGLRRLGYDVCLAEVIAPENCVDGAGVRTDFASSANRAYFEAVTAEFGLADSAGLICTGTHEAAGLGYDELLDRAADAELVINVSGHLRLRELLGRPRLRAYVDMDPGFTQAWLASGAPGLRSGRPRSLRDGGREPRPARVPDPDRGPGLGPDGTACGARGVAGRGAGAKPGAVYDPRDLARPVRAGRDRRRGPLDSSTTSSARSWSSPGESRPRRSRSRSTSIRRMPTIWRRCARTAGESPIPIGGRRPAHLPQYIQGSAAEFSVAQGVYVEHTERLVQRPHGVLPGLGPAGAGAGHRVRSQLPGR